MEHCLKSDDKYLALYRKYQPIDEVTIDHIKRADSLRLREAICAHYEVNPFMPPKAEMPKKTSGKLIISVEEEDTPIELDSIAIHDTRRLLYLTSFLNQNHPYALNPNELFAKLGFENNFLDFYTFTNTADWNTYRILDSFNRSLLANSVELLDDKNIDTLVSKEAYVE